MSNTPFFDAYNSLVKKYPGHREIDYYRETLRYTDGICFHPMQFRTVVEKLNRRHKKIDGEWVEVCEYRATGELFKNHQTTKRHWECLNNPKQHLPQDVDGAIWWLSNTCWDCAVCDYFYTGGEVKLGHVATQHEREMALAKILLLATEE